MQLFDLQHLMLSAQKGNRTPTHLREPDFESSASTDSAIWAGSKLAETGCLTRDIPLI